MCFGDLLCWDRVDLAGDVLAEVVGLEALYRRLDDSDSWILGTVATLPRGVRLVGLRDATFEKPLGLRTLHNVSDRADDHLGAAHAERQGKPLIRTAGVPRTDELRTRVAEQAVQCLVVVAGDHNGTPGREAIEQRRLDSVEVLVLVDEHRLVGLDSVLMCFEGALNSEYRIVKAHGVVVVAAFDGEGRRSSRLEPPHESYELRHWAPMGDFPVGLDK